MTSQLQSKEDEKLLKLLNANDGKALIGDKYKSDNVRLILIQDENTAEDFKPSGRALCMVCKRVLAAKDGGHISRHVKICMGKRAMSEPAPDEVNITTEEPEEPSMKQRKLTEFSRKKFSRDQTAKITISLAKHYGKEAVDQLPCRNTIQKQVLAMSENILQRTFEEMKPFAGRRVNFVCDHGKLVVHYLSIFASFLDDAFQLKLLPIGFVPCTDGKSGSETAKVIIERMVNYGWVEEQVKSCSITADGALKTLSDHFDTYIRCVNHSIHLVGERVVKPRENHKKLMNSECLEMLEKARLALENAQVLSSSIRNNIRACGELSKLPTLPNDTRWLNQLKCLEDVTDLATEIQIIAPQLSAKGKAAMFWLSDNSKIVNSVLLILRPLLQYNVLFQTQNKVTIHHVLPSYRLLETKWRRYEARTFSELKDKDSLDLDVVQALACSGSYAIKHYYSEFDRYHYAAVLLNPKTKKMTMFDEFEKDRAISFVTELLPSETPAVTHRKSNIPDYIREMSDSVEEQPKHGDLQRYMEEYVDSQNEESIEEYWNRKRRDFPSLFEVAGKILSVVPSESVCETTFSTAAFLLDKRRSRLQYSSAEKVVVGCQIATKSPEWLD